MLAVSSPLAGELEAREKPRVFVSTDIGGSDPDDYQSMVHYLIYADEFETEGLISSPPHAGRAGHILECIAAYEKDYESLRAVSADYPAPERLRRLTRQGAVDPQAGDEPDSEISEGAKLLIERARIDDRRPLYVLVWGSITDVAQAVRADPSIKAKIRIYSIGSWNTRMDEKARAYLFRQRKDLWWIENDTTFRGMYMGGEQSGEWGNESFPQRNVRGHGHLGALFMEKYPVIKMGDTPSVLYLLSGDPDDPDSESWGGSFVKPDADCPSYWHDDRDPALAYEDKPGAITVNRWRTLYLQDWKERMDRALAP